MKNLMKALSFFFIAGLFIIAPVSTYAKDVIVGKFSLYYEDYVGCTKVFMNVTGSGAVSPSGNLETSNCIYADESIIMDSFISFAQSQQCAVGNNTPAMVNTGVGQEISFSCIAWEDPINKANNFLSFPLTFEPPPVPAN